jgi:hypothetical protein
VFTSAVTAIGSCVTVTSNGLFTSGICPTFSVHVHCLVTFELNGQCIYGTQFHGAHSAGHSAAVPVPLRGVVRAADTSSFIHRRILKYSEMSGWWCYVYESGNIFVNIIIYSPEYTLFTCIIYNRFYHQSQPLFFNVNITSYYTLYVSAYMQAIIKCCKHCMWFHAQQDADTKNKIHVSCLFPRENKQNNFQTKGVENGLLRNNKFLLHTYEPKNKHLFFPKSSIFKKKPPFSFELIWWLVLRIAPVGCSLLASV